MMSRMNNRSNHSSLILFATKYAFDSISLEVKRYYRLITLNTNYINLLTA